jgi:hypothetical protein
MRISFSPSFILGIIIGVVDTKQRQSEVRFVYVWGSWPGWQFAFTRLKAAQKPKEFSGSILLQERGTNLGENSLFAS